MEKLRFIKMKTKDYYIKELNSLRVDGAQFAKKNPGLSSYLAKEGQDPDVERMLEGFAFLTGRLHQKFDEELPEVAHNLVQLLWPNYIRPIPSYAIIKFDALKNDLKNQEVPKGLQVLSQTSSQGVTCKFKTSFKTQVMPLKLDDTEYLTQGKKATIELNLKMSVAGNLSEVSFETLRLFLGGSKFMAKELYLYLSRYVENIEVIIKDKTKKEIDRIYLSKNSVSAVGFNASETIVPHPKNTFDGYVMMQEYFCFQDKHLFLDIKNLEQIENISVSSLSQSNSFSLKFHLSKRLSTAQLPTTDDFHLFCTPVINLFESDAVPIRKTEEEDEYILIPSELKKEHSEVFSIENVRGWIPRKNIYQDYYPFESFGDISDEGEYYSERIKLNEVKNRTDTFLRFASPSGAFTELEHSAATVSVKMMSTNKDIPSTLQLGSLCVNDPISSSDLSFHNITIPSVSYPPPIGGDFLWKLISNMSLNYLSLENISTLKMILQTYDFFGASDIRQKEKTDTILSGLISISNKRIQMIYEGLPIRGIETELYLDPTKFTGIGEAYHLCCILNEFFSLYCSVNSFHKLVVHIENHETFSWPVKIGNKDLV